MSTLKPFRVLRPRPDIAARVCTLPYDVMNADEARAMAEGNPSSFLRVTRSEIEFDAASGVDPYSDEVYAKGGANLKALVADGTLVREPDPAYMLYRLTMGSHSQLGLVAVAMCSEYDSGLIKKHELTRPDKEDDRKRHIELIGAQTGNVFLTYRAHAATDSLLAGLAAAAAPDIDFTAEDGIRHEAWIVRDTGAVTGIEAAFATNVPALYVADGHHRSAAASRVAAARRPAGSPPPAPSAPVDAAPAEYFLTVSFPHDQMQILAYNRVVKDLNGLTPAALLEELAAVGELSDAPADRQPAAKGEVAVYLGRAAGGWKKVRWNAATLAAQKAAGGDIALLDVSVLQDAVLAPTLDVGDPRTDKRIGFVGGIRGMDELERLVDGGGHAVAFAMFATSITDLIDIADQGGIMPPKSTWFEPKLRDAMAVHLLDR